MTATLVEDAELRRWKEIAQGVRPFRRSKRLERLAALDSKRFWKLPARDRLLVGYFQTARLRAETLREDAPDQAR